MTNYQNISSYQDDNIGDSHGSNDSKAVPEHLFSYKRHIVGGVLAFGLLMLGCMGRYSSIEGTSKSTFFFSSRPDGSFCRVRNVPENDSCENTCCPKVLYGHVGVCRMCCFHGDCSDSFPQPPAGEFGTPFCDRKTGTCISHPNEERIPEEGYPTWVPSETIDNAKEYRKLNVPRHVVPGTDPVMDQVWYFDFNEQEDIGVNMDDIIYTKESISIPVWTMMHAGYSKSYATFDEDETGIVTLVGGDNEDSLVTNYPKIIVVEKYHTLTFEGKKDVARAEFMKKNAREGLKEGPWKQKSWLKRATNKAIGLMRRYTINSQVEAGIDQAVMWQARRFANDFPESARGTLNASTVRRWGEHAKKAKKALNLAKDPNFEREYLKSEQHCKHFEEGQGADYSETHFTLPLGRPIVTSSGEMINAPTHYFGLAGGVAFVDFDKEAKILQIYFQAHGVSRQYPDRAFPGPNGVGSSALYVSAVADGPDYYVDPKKDGRSNDLMSLKQPLDDLSVAISFREVETDYTLWARPRSETCEDGIEEADFWTEINLPRGFESIWQVLPQAPDIVKGLVKGMPCADVWMRSDAGPGTHGFDSNEVGVWGHYLLEVTDEETRTLSLARWWDNWECFYQKRDVAECQAPYEQLV